MKKTLTLLAFCLLSLNLTAQDSLRLTLDLDGFNTKDEVYLILGDTAYKIDTSQDSFQLNRSIKEPRMAMIRFKSRAQTFWVENGEITVEVPKRGFIGGVKVSGSSSQSLWEEILKAPKDERAKILEENIDTKMAQSYLANRSNKLFPEDQERLLAMSNPKTNDLAKYSISLLGLDVSERLKEGEPMMDFIASTIDDQQTSTEDLRGKFILLDFAGTGCGWCWVEYPNMVESLEKYENLKVLTINQDFAYELWQKRADQKNINLPWPVLWKAENKKEIFAKYGIQVLPTHYLISPEGIILERWQGAKDNKLERALEKHKVN
ncbi:MAG: AhpC/TSA family protein [Roseivirga sp.]|jgi:peroxiredoxin|uniref:TlpA disulfide reductase family protein n=1 Tax=Roseivirga sp. TaxID=1964215 RepID=UPI001B0DE737|nr:TlpA disulfide reductase family protein [Roseivirga sp.]MBO6497052.1 AhpC/TSA family protein [Roseivirga sp.]